MIKTLSKNKSAITKSDLITKVAQNKNLPYAIAEKIVETMFNEISNALIRGDRVELRGFGVFSVRNRSSRVGRNPRNGVSIKIPSKMMPFFRCGSRLRDRIKKS